MASLLYHVSLRLAHRRRARYARTLEARAAAPLDPPRELPINVVSYCGARDVVELVASWRSLLRHAGRPTRLVLVSDGSVTPAQADSLRRFPAPIEVRSFQEFLTPRLPDAVHRYAAAHPLGKKLAMLTALDQFLPALYSDSDILYFPAARQLAARFAQEHPPIQYLVDCGMALDRRLLRTPAEAEERVNSGFLYLREPLGWEQALQRFIELGADGEYFTEQTLTHLAVRLAGGRPLPTSEYVLQVDDQWSWRDYHAPRPIVLRHYVSTIRHKMWRQVGPD